MCRTSNGYDSWGEDSIKNNINCLIKDKPLYDDVFSSCVKDGRGNICPSTIILPTLAMEANRNVEQFMKLLEQTIEEVKDSLLERFEYIANQSPSSASFMYGNGSMGGYVPEEGIRSALRHGTIVIGQIGLAETLELLIGTDQTTPAGMELAKRIEQLYKDKCAEYKEKLHINTGVYYTPSENLCFTSMNKFKEKYGIIKNVSDHDYFTNSIHVPVWKDMTPFEKIDIESQLTGYSNAGCITYVELESLSSKNIKSLEKLVNYAMEKDIPYFALNLPLSTCLNCGFAGEINNKCPQCNSDNIEYLARVTGYLSTDKRHFNLGKQAEVKDRVKHKGCVNC